MYLAAFHIFIACSPWRRGRGSRGAPAVHLAIERVTEYEGGVA